MIRSWSPESSHPTEHVGKNHILVTGTKFGITGTQIGVMVSNTQASPTKTNDGNNYPHPKVTDQPPKPERTRIRDPETEKGPPDHRIQPSYAKTEHPNELKSKPTAHMHREATKKASSENNISRSGPQTEY